MRRYTLALAALFLAMGVALSVSLFAPSKGPKAKASVSQRPIAQKQEKGLKARASVSQRLIAKKLEKGPKAKASVSQRPIAQKLDLSQEENNTAFSQYVENLAPVPSSTIPEVPERGTPDSEHFVSQGSIATGPTLREEHFPPYSQVVDNSSPGRFRAPGWDIRSSDPDDYRRNYRVARPSESAKPARFKVEVPATDTYSVYAWWPAKKDNNAAARFGIRTTSGLRWTKVNQRREGGLWIKLGEYRMEAGDSYAVRVSASSRRDGYVVADAVAVVRGVLSAPPEKSYEKTTSEGAMHGASTSVIEGERIVELARSHLGTSYRLSPSAPCQAHSSEDCSCLTSLVFEKFDIQLPDNPSSQWHYGRSVPKDELRPGDLVFFKESGPNYPITHVGIYAGRGYVIQASSYYGKVVESQMSYIKGYYGAKRL